MKCIPLLIALVFSLVCASSIGTRSANSNEPVHPADPHHEHGSKPEANKPSPEKSPVQASRSASVSSSQESICLMMESAAAANGLPLGFFVRVIWKESSF